MLTLYGPAVLVAFVITLLEMTEVVVLVFALSADHSTVAHGALGALGGVTAVALLALAFGAVVLAFPHDDLLWASAVLLVGFGVFLFRGTLHSYQRSRTGRPSSPAADSPRGTALQFAGGFSVGAVEATEVVVVLIALAAAGYGLSALVGAVVAGTALAIATLFVHEQIRRITVPLLRLGATSMLFTFAVFWAGEAAGVRWPGDDFFLVPLFLAALVLVRGGVGLGLRRSTSAVAPA